MTNAPVPPHSENAEASVIGAILLGSDNTLATVGELVQPDDFYFGSLGAAYRACLTMQAAGQPVDTITLVAHLHEQGALQKVGGKDRVHELAAITPATANVAHYARIVRDCARRRQMIRVGSETTQLGYQPEGDVDQAVDRVQQLAYELADHTAESVNLETTVRGVLDELQTLQANPRQLLGAPVGIPDLDQVTRGFRKGDLVVVAADTGRGKSALALNAALHLSVGLGQPVAFYSLEMSSNELVGRALALGSRIPYDRLTRGDIGGSEEWERLVKAASRIAQAPLELRADATIRPSGLRSHLRQWKTRNPDGALAIVDYLQLLTPDEKTDNRTSDVSSISRALKTTAMSLDLPILAVSQLRRRQPSTKPHRNDLRESGSIENDASVVILIHHPEDTPGTAELICAKNRHGAEATVRVTWVGPLMRFKALETGRHLEAVA